MECAKALCELHQRQGTGFDLTADDLAALIAAGWPNYVEEARACVLKWLEQEPSSKMGISEGDWAGLDG